ncbi:uncharacterized protein HMPREF1541_08119 [Cyphellophora europaea CBS 101466]|uniref:Enoyl reductase (ER) domain-containing protein n=1 Tax=Cyphellophora europaea (strain CBS 101466) TaxID=1220924 RepID=W2RN11_CYPE1|nr:uncharacterized protein HMPREF1541_08119 [Cyphellophora europaea CBS 101466]ETN37129.1 hypothetical protein HMPREF1541_08119 [Cyphellophora europaea CBS 101466]
MKAIVFNAQGEPATLAERNVPDPGPNEVLVKVSTTALNPHDQKIKDLGLLIKEWPWIPGSDVAGTVEKLGPDVTKYQVGDRVFGQGNFLSPRVLDFAGLQEYALVDDRCSAKVPPGLSDDDATTMPTNAATAFFGFFANSGFALPVSSLGGKAEFDASSHDLVVLGGSSQLGKLIIQFAKVMGWRSVVVTAGPQNTDSLKQLGATHVVSRHGNFDDMVRQIRDVVGDDDLQYCFNVMHSDRTLGAALLSGSGGGSGHLANFVHGTVDYARAGKKEADFEDTFVQGMTLLYPELGRYFWDHLPTWLVDGSLKVPKWSVIEGLDVTKVNEVLDKWKDQEPVPDHPHVHPNA